MLLLLQREDHVAGIGVGVLVGHLAERDLVAVGRALLDVDFEDLALLLGLKALASAATCAALALHLLDHRAHPDHLDPHAAAVALAALLDAPLLVDHLSGDRHLLGVPVVHLLQGHLQGLHDVLCLLPPALPTAAGESGEEPLERVAAAAAAALLEALLAEPVVLGALVRITEHLVRAGDLLEHFRVAALVRVVLHGELAVRLLDLGLAGVLVDLEQLVELCSVGRLAFAAALPAHAREVAARHARKTAEKHRCDVQELLLGRGGGVAPSCSKAARDQGA
mmetsp:Transcript_30826/g.93262  ORF Transcript_30826/g.93262 Transcript_30826/m.93262 type:complete len:280 (+) Transcript_30826:804-1643(+)